MQLVTPNRKKDFDDISDIKKSPKSGKRSGERKIDVDSSEDDLLDEMSKFVEAADMQLEKDRSSLSLVEEDEKLKKL